MNANFRCYQFVKKVAEEIMELVLRVRRDADLLPCRRQSRSDLLLLFQGGRNSDFDGSQFRRGHMLNLRAC